MNESIPIASLNHYIYCHHRCWRIFCAGEFSDNQYTIEGSAIHDRVHTLGDSSCGETWQVRAIWLYSHQYGLIGKSDLIEEQDGSIYPVEYKRGDRGEYDNDAVQVCAQVLCLEEMTNQTINKGYVYYAQSHQREEIIITPELRQTTISVISEIRELFQTGKMPPAVYTKRCKGCSLYTQCLPEAKEKLQKYSEA